MKKLLVIEDDQLVREALEHKLSSGGYLVLLALDGEQGIQIMRAKMPDLVLVDTVLPKKSGIELIEGMRQDDILKDIPVIAISNAGDVQEIEQLKSLGVLKFIIKTHFDLDETMQIVKMQLQESIPAEAPTEQGQIQ